MKRFGALFGNFGVRGAQNPPVHCVIILGAAKDTETLLFASVPDCSASLSLAGISLWIYFASWPSLLIGRLFGYTVRTKSVFDGALGLSFAPHTTQFRTTYSVIGISEGFIGVTVRISQGCPFSPHRPGHGEPQLVYVRPFPVPRGYRIQLVWT